MTRPTALHRLPRVGVGSPTSVAAVVCRRVGAAARRARWAVASAWRHRVLGLAAEIAFWTLLCMPPLLLCLLGMVGYLTGPLGADLVPAVEAEVLSVAARIVTPDTVSSLIQPVVHDVLTQGRADVASIGFLLALFSGSTAMNSYVNAIAIAYDQRDQRSAVHSRLLALGLYLAALAVGVLFLPLLVAGPELLLQLAPADGRAAAQTTLTAAYWPAMAIVSVLFLTTLYHLGVPRRTRWRDHLPGAVVAMGIWLAGSLALRVYLAYAFRTVDAYGPAATPIAALLFFYLCALAVLLGAETNAATTGGRHTPTFLPGRPDERGRQSPPL